MSVKERVVTYVKYKKISNSAFCKAIGVSNAFISSMRKSIQPDKLESIALIFPDLNITWLLTGKGSMLKDSFPNLVSEPQASYLGNQNLDRELDLLKTQLKDKERIISMLEKEVLRLENELKKFTL